MQILSLPFAFRHLAYPLGRPGDRDKYTTFNKVVQFCLDISSECHRYFPTRQSTWFHCWIDLEAGYSKITWRLICLAGYTHNELILVHSYQVHISHGFQTQKAIKIVWHYNKDSTVVFTSANICDRDPSFPQRFDFRDIPHNQLHFSWMNLFLMNKSLTDSVYVCTRVHLKANVAAIYCQFSREDFLSFAVYVCEVCVKFIFRVRKKISILMHSINNKTMCQQRALCRLVFVNTQHLEYFQRPTYTSGLLLEFDCLQQPANWPWQQVFSWFLLSHHKGFSHGQQRRNSTLHIDHGHPGGGIGY